VVGWPLVSWSSGRALTDQRACGPPPDQDLDPVEYPIQPEGEPRVVVALAGLVVQRAGRDDLVQRRVALRSVARNIVSTLLVFGVAFLIGFRPHASPLDRLGTAGTLLLFVLAISWLSAAVGLLAKSPEVAGEFTFFVSFLPYPSSAFVPIETMPARPHGIAENQPVTPVIETLRGLLLGLRVADNLWRAVTWCGGILVASVAVSGILFRRRTDG
jgi:ABC-type polysaccharide/polyol phosphate export permease